MKQMFGDIRVSTVKQGQGVSLAEQKRAIEIYASRNQLEIARWFEEKETAAKKGRPIFSQMLKLLSRKKAEGVIIHKIDRSARNLRDWADIGELIDSGIEIHFAHEALDLAARSGRLSADIQAVIAADYIRNLREETKKGMYGRLRQGFYPWAAPVGYLDKGPGKLKEIDPVMGPLVRRLYTLYATKRYGYVELADKMYELGLRNKRNGKVSKSGIGAILHNPFYMGIIKIHASNQVFMGKHEPLIDKELFDRVQDISGSRTAMSRVRHNHLFRRRINCGLCGGVLTGELHKGTVYYYCHGHECPLQGIREDNIERELHRRFEIVELSTQEVEAMKREMRKKKDIAQKKDITTIKSLELHLSQIESRMDRLVDTLMDGLIDEEQYNRKKEHLLHEAAEIRDRLSRNADDNDKNAEDSSQVLELLKNLANTYSEGNTADKQLILDFLTSNFRAFPEKLEISTVSPFFEIAKRKGVLGGVHHRDDLRTGFAKTRNKRDRPKNTVHIVFVDAADDSPASRSQKQHCSELL